MATGAVCSHSLPACTACPFPSYSFSHCSFSPQEVSEQWERRAWGRVEGCVREEGQRRVRGRGRCGEQGRGGSGVEGTHLNGWLLVTRHCMGRRLSGQSGGAGVVSV